MKKILSYKKYLFVIMILLFSIFPLTIFAAEGDTDSHYELSKEYDDDGNENYVLKTIFLSVDEYEVEETYISEEEYYEILNREDEYRVDNINKYIEELEDSHNNKDSNGEIIPPGFSSILILDGKTETQVLRLSDVNEESFEDVIKIQDGNDTKYYVLLSNERYAEIDGAYYYYYFYKYHRNVHENEELNKYVEENYSSIGHAKFQGFLEGDIQGYTIYIKVQEYFSNKSYSYFLYSEDDYTLLSTLPEGDYYIVSGGILNDETYSYPISTPDFSIHPDETTNVYFTIGDKELPTELKEENKSNQDDLIETMTTKDDSTNIQEIAETVVESVSNEKDNSSLIITLFKVVPIVLTSIVVIGLGILIYIKKNNQ